MTVPVVVDEYFWGDVGRRAAVSVRPLVDRLQHLREAKINQLDMSSLRH